jgi:hypothetical protein
MDSFKDKLTVKEVKSALKTLPRGSDAYDKAYRDAMERILAKGSSSCTRAKKLLAWILCARRPLSAPELLHALAIEPGDTEVDEDNILEPEQLITMCAGLVTIHEQSNTVRFIHPTTSEYLQRHQQYWLPDANVELARTCTAYLSISDLDIGPCSSRKEYELRLGTLVLLDYAAVHWGHHMSALAGEHSSRGHDSVVAESVSCLANEKALYSASQALFMSGWYFSGTYVAHLGSGFSGSHWIARFGLKLLFEEWSSREVQWDDSDFDGRTPLLWAAEKGHEATVKLLLDTGEVDADSKDTRYGQTPLSWAAEKGHEATVKLLLDTGEVDADSKDTRYGQTPLSWAAEKGHEATVKLLLDTGEVDADSKDTRYGQTPLSWAAEYGHETTVKLLLDTGKVDVNSMDYDGRTPLSWGAEFGHGAVALLLLRTGGIAVNMVDRSGLTPLS